MRIVVRDKFYLSHPSVWQSKHLITKRLIVLWTALISLWKPQASLPLLSSGWSINLVLPFCLWTSHVCRSSCACKIKFDFFLLICLRCIWLLDQTKELLKCKGKCFLPNTFISYCVEAPFQVRVKLRTWQWMTISYQGEM